MAAAHASYLLLTVLLAPSHLKEFRGNAGILDKLPSDCKNIAKKDGHLFEYRLKGSNTDRVIWKWTKASASQSYW